MNIKTIAFLVFLGTAGLAAFLYGAYYEYSKKKSRQPTADDYRLKKGNRD